MSYLCYVFIALWWLVGTLTGWSQQGYPAGHVGHYQGQRVVVGGTIVPGSVQAQREHFVSLQLEVEELQGKAGRGKLYVGITKWPQQNFPSSGYLELEGEVQELAGLANPGGFDSARQARYNDFGGSMQVEAPQVLYQRRELSWRERLFQLHTKLVEQISQAVAERDAAVMAGMLLGGYAEVDTEVLRSFATTGIIHMLSVSGSHVALLLGVLLSLLRHLRCKERWSLALASAFLVLYAALCGFRAPVVRAVLMGLALLLGQGIGRRGERGAILGAAAFAMLCYRPLWLWELGFQLSFASTAGLIYLLPSLQQRLARYLPRAVVDYVAVSLAAQLASLPLLWGSFHQLSLLTLLANVVIVPLLELVLILTLFGVLLSLLIGLLGRWCLIAASIILWPAVQLAQALAQCSWALLPLGRGSFLAGGAYYCALALWVTKAPSEYLSQQWRQRGLVVCSLVIAVSLSLQLLVPPEFAVYFLDVGQGDCALIVTPERRVIVVDTGGLQGKLNTGERVLVPALHYLGFRSVDALFLSHGHHDHAGGAAALAKQAPVRRVFLAQEEPSDDVLALLAVQQRQGQCETVKTNEQITLGNCIIDIISSPCVEPGAGGNENSVLMKLTYQGQSILFTGDATSEGEEATLRQNLQASVLKVSHHGSATSSAPEFLRAVAPQLAVISVGAHNHFGHPASSTLSKLQEQGVQVHRTDQEGALKLTFVEGKPQCIGYRRNPEKF